MPTHIQSIEQFETILQDIKNEKKPMIIIFSAKWCGPCKQIEPIYHSLEAKYSNVVFVAVDIEKHEELAKKYHIKGMPTFVLIKYDGTECERLIGAHSDELINLVFKYGHK